VAHDTFYAVSLDVTSVTFGFAELGTIEDLDVNMTVCRKNARHSVLNWEKAITAVH